MRVAVLAVVAALSVAHADTDPAPSAPPSKTLERAIKLYDRKDFFSASIELRKVVDGETGDDAVNTQRAKFFMGKTLYQIGFYEASNATFQQIASDPKQTYFNATAKWLVALVKLLGRDNVGALQAYKLDVADDPSLASVKDELLLYLGQNAIDKSDWVTAFHAFDKVDRQSSTWARARLGVAVASFRSGDDPRALKAFAEVPANSDASDLAALGVVTVSVHAKKWDDAIAAAGKVGKSMASRAAWESQVAKAAKKGSLGGIDAWVHTDVWTLDAPAPVVGQLVATCDDKSDAFATIRKDGASIAKEIDAVLAANDDNAEMYERYVKTLRDGKDGKLGTRANALVKAWLARPDIDQRLVFAAEIGSELALLQKSDKAWQTTAVAAEVLQELTVADSIAQADLGKVVHERLEQLSEGIRTIAADKTKLPCS